MANDNFNDKIQQTMEQQSGLNRRMKSRHLFMITLGGVIGTGLFLASGSTINQAGPIGCILAYAIGGFIMYMVMLCLGELAVEMPVAGAFQTYASIFISPAFGYLLGWLYWLNGAITIGIDLVAAGMLLTTMTGISEWIWVLLFGCLLFGLNSLRVDVFGESEFWFASIKVGAIIACIVVGGLAIMGYAGGHEAIGFKNYFTDGAFPNGIGAVLLAMITVAYSYNGTEIIGVAAGESEKPEKTIPKAINNTAFRTLLFYVLSMVVVAAIVPWKEAGVKDSTFAEIFQYAGVPGAYRIMTLVVITSALSCGNSWCYSATRILWAMSKENMAPAVFGKLNRWQVPMNALILTMAVSAVSLLCSVVAVDTLYLWLISVCGLACVLGWMGICASQYCFRKQYVNNGGKVANLKYKVPFFPLVPFLGFFLNLIIIIGLWFDESQRIAIYVGVPFILLVMIYYYVFVAPKRKMLSNRAGGHVSR
ncbi:amino acid permease [Sporomusa acidovorans]|uniref:Amino-acid permease RocC n=1 Tax=Sporomusa acidovorans (strain ATCC 49682 / DSM 3132 / Mol) TaxID=1123286 RepID=A0ABZ3J4X0_SPOA4|nr:amino acid permease [Sporomusa acidovorans]OZC15548.1 amino-acid permease RocC [Sporomusa acidovorans DSM 3132]SDE17775.1 arginine:proton symporter, AAT family (TC 2.A.3.1.11) [Sporomusa acidovorans]